MQRYSSVFRLVPEANVRLLRCFMAAALLPGDAARIRASGRPFTEAATRVHDLPQIRITGSGEKPDETLWNGMMNMPLLVLMVGDALPSWAEALAGERPAVVLSQDDAVLRAAEGLGMFPSLLAGKKDLREFYRALQSLCAHSKTRHISVPQGHRPRSCPRGTSFRPASERARTTLGASMRPLRRSIAI